MGKEIQGVPKETKNTGSIRRETFVGDNWTPAFEYYRQSLNENPVADTVLWKKMLEDIGTDSSSPERISGILRVDNDFVWAVNTDHKDLITATKVTPWKQKTRAFITVFPERSDSVPKALYFTHIEPSERNYSPQEVNNSIAAVTDYLAKSFGDKTDNMGLQIQRGGTLEFLGPFKKYKIPSDEDNR
jgi:hypothetical protein